VVVGEADIHQPRFDLENLPASVSVWVGELETNRGFSTQREDAERGIRAAERLWDWFQTNRSKLESVYLLLLKKVEHPSNATSVTR
jgi:hypothetical protein